MTAKNIFLSVAVPTPIRCLFDYLPEKNVKHGILQPGLRVSVSFGQRKNITGIIVLIKNKTNHPKHKLKRINHIIDDCPVIHKKHLDLLLWASNYYHYPIGEVIHNALPALLRKNKSIPDYLENFWSLSALENNNLLSIKSKKISSVQTKILNYIGKNRIPISEFDLINIFPRVKQSLHALEKNGLIKKENKKNIELSPKIIKRVVKLNEHQKNAVNTIADSMKKHSIFLLDGLTGSGKTEVYMSVMESVIKHKKQCLVLLPEIGLTPQIIQRFKNRFEVDMAIQHSGLSDIERFKYWQDAKTGKAKIILGTRSAVWVPLKKPGIYIVDEEHDLSYKQRSGFQYSARDLLIVRAKRDGVPIVLGSATPSLETINNAEKNRYTHLILPTRAGAAKKPEYQLLDIQNKKMHGPLSQTLLDEIDKNLKLNNQILLFLNRRGYATTLYCHKCSWKAQCDRCEIPLTYHKSNNRLHCHNCGSSKENIKDCPLCKSNLLRLGHGTKRIEEVLSKKFPKSNIARIDRDTTQKKDSMDNYLKKMHSGEIDILVGTQMIAKGHHFPNVTLAAIVDADRGLFSTDFRAPERLAQLFIQVSGRTGRGKKKGVVIVQTYNPKHPLFHNLIKHGYNYLAKSLLKERKLSSLPPYSYIALLRVEAHNIKHVKYFIENASMRLKRQSEGVLLLFGPVPALTEKHSGRFRYQLVIQAKSRKVLHEHINNWLQEIEKMKSSKKVRWSLDIDPLDMN